jgi:hypothetical protein
VSDYQTLTYFAASVLMVPVPTMTTAMTMWKTTMAIDWVLIGIGAIADPQ